MKTFKKPISCFFTLVLVLSALSLSACGKSVSGGSSGGDGSTVNVSSTGIPVLPSPTPTASPSSSPSPTPSTTVTAEINCKVFDLYSYFSAAGVFAGTATPSIPDYSSLTPVAEITLSQFDVDTTDWASGYPDFPANLKYLTEWYGMSCQGYFTAPSSGNYQFQVKSDDGADFWVDSELIVNGNGEHSPTTFSGSVVLSEGVHAFQMDWYQGPRTQIALLLTWQPPAATSAVMMPASAFTSY